MSQKKKRADGRKQHFHDRVKVLKNKITELETKVRGSTMPK